MKIFLVKRLVFFLPNCCQKKKEYYKKNAKGPRKIFVSWKIFSGGITLFISLILAILELKKIYRKNRLRIFC